MSRKLGALLVVICASVACVLTASGDQASQTSVDRTTPILKKMTPAQREHAELHKHRGFGTTIRVLDRKATVDVSADFQPGPARLTSADWLTEKACQVDAVLLGVVERSEVLPTSDGTALFSDYEMHLPEVLKADRRKGISAFGGETVVVTRPGGVTYIDGEKVGTVLRSHPPLTVGSTYLVFAKYLPKFKTYDASGPADVFAVADGKVKSFVAIATTDGNLLTDGVEYDRVRAAIGRASCK